MDPGAGAAPNDLITVPTVRAHAKTPLSRRARPAKASLSQKAIADATNAIIQDDGLAAATMRRVARALETGPASLYVYFASTSELHAAVLDHLVGTLDLGVGGDVTPRLSTLLADYRDLLFAHPGLARSALQIYPSGPNTIAFLDTVLGLLLDDGVEPDRAAWAVDLLMLYVTAIAAEHSDPGAVADAEPSAHTQRALSDAIHRADPQTRPHIARHAAVLVGGSATDRWDWALEVILAGATRSPVPWSPRAAPGAGGVHTDSDGGRS